VFFSKKYINGGEMHMNGREKYMNQGEKYIFLRGKHMD